MKKILLLLLCLCSALLQADEPDCDALDAEAKRHLINLFNIDTSQP